METITEQHPADNTAPRRALPHLPLSGRRVLISGASGNIGSVLAERLAIEGASVALHYQNNAEAVNRLLELVNTASTGQVRAVAVRGKLDDYYEAERVFAEAESELGGIDVLINCVGMSRDNSLLMLTEEDVAAVIQGNLAPVVYLSQFMTQQQSIEHGRIINITSITGLVGQPMRSLYGAAKGAVIAYTKSVARQIANKGWTANCIAPQVVQGGLASHMKSHAQTLISSVTPIKKTCTPDDLTGLAAFLAAPESGFVTGTVLNVTGGLITW
ncbi:SDR family oxidoreductase [Methylicorpusculum oleiharenae]|uniref:SDR family NAD(P)-dependent oxidoreductase n=1 Tax=Methylicorpusculum oleiharenae TaxID=1338687 RepID=UPI001357E430|nr:SDR family oxidoreductase [Methylicorpusculum oleiharenae]MCD2451457.1 SDR family oxidoreductase [Methylicorpusculum oleiharenae]